MYTIFLFGNNKWKGPFRYLFFFSACFQVANAAKRNASAVLIYPDTTDDSIGDAIPLFGHVCGQFVQCN